MEEETWSIESLPNDVLLRIISFLPLEEAVRTSILSWRWKNLWTPVLLNINIDSIEFRDSSEVFTVDNFLSSLESPMISRNFCFFRDYSGEQPSEMTTMAVKGVQKEVYLQFLSTKETNSLGFELKLDQTLNPKPAAALSSSLRKLHIRSVSSRESSFVSSIFSSCRFLETLKIEKCNHLKSVTVEKNDRLENLIISDCPEIRSVSVSAVKMVSFCYRGVLPIIELKNASNLNEVELDLSDGPLYGEFECEDVIDLFATMQEIQKLKISGWLLQWMCSGGVIYGRLEFKLSKLKELTWIDASMDGPKRDSLCCFLNICPVLTNLFININRNRRRVGYPFFHQNLHDPHMWVDYTTMKANVLPLKHLKVVEMSCFPKEEEEEMTMMQLMDLFREKAPMLEVMSTTHLRDQ